MTPGRLKRIFWLAGPIMGGMLSQNLLDLVDTAMVGTLGAVSLAAVGVGAFANFMCVALVLGLAAGVQTLVARRQGEGRLDESAVPLTAGLISAIAFGVPLCVVLYQFAPVLFPLVNADPAVVAEGVPYLEVRLLALVCIGANHCFRGYLNGTEQTRLYLMVIVAMHLINVVLNWLLIFGNAGLPAMGSYGAGLGTTISIFIGTALYFMVVTPRAKPQGFLHRLPGPRVFRALLALSIPNSLQTLFFAAGFLALFWIIGQINTDAVAISNVIVNLLKAAVLPGLALGLASMTLVSDAIGRRELADASTWGWNVVVVAVVIMTLLALPALLFPSTVLGLFLHDASLIQGAVVPLRITAAAVLLDAIGMVIMNSLIGAGDARRAMVISIACQWGIGLPLCYVLGVLLGYGLTGIWLAQAVYRLVQAIILAGIWRNGSWQSRRLTV